MGKCSKCSSINIKKASMIAKAGSSSTKGLGIASGGVGLGYAESKSKLAKEASFKAPKDGLLSDLQGCLTLIVATFISLLTFIGVGAFFGNSDTLTIVIAGSISIVIFGTIVNKSASRGAWSKSELRLKQAKMDYENTWMCLDCGHKWVAQYKSKEKKEPAKTSKDVPTKVKIGAKNRLFGCLKYLGLFFIISLGLTLYFGDRVSWVNVDSLDIHSEPNGQVIGKVKFGERLTIKDTVSGWSQIERGGWVDRKFLSVNDPNIKEN